MASEILKYSWSFWEDVLNYHLSWLFSMYKNQSHLLRHKMIVRGEGKGVAWCEEGGGMINVGVVIGVDITTRCAGCVL